MLASQSAITVEANVNGQKYRNLKGMNWLVTCLFIVGETAGGGLIAMPTAMIAAGWFKKLQKYSQAEIDHISLIESEY